VTLTTSDYILALRESYIGKRLITKQKSIYSHRSPKSGGFANFTESSSGEPIAFTHEEGLTAADWVGFAQHQYRSAILRLGDGVVVAPPSKRRGDPLRAS
jgi:hypothetical protein